MIWAVTALSTVFLVGVFRVVALQRQWFDLPSARSSHHKPVPRGAGLVLVGVISIAIAAHWYFDSSLAFFVLSCLPGWAIASAGWFDDVRGLKAATRFFIYGMACVFATLALARANANVIYAMHPPALKVLAISTVAVALLWWVNLYNFMDGINGIAGLEGIFIALALILLSASNIPPTVFSICGIVAASLLGFLPWNFPIARVFMGDVGSASLGFLLGLISLWCVLKGSLTLWQILIIGGVFIVDATYTLIVRVISGQRWHEPHRSHAYQRLADHCGSHTIAVSILMSINVVWLLPLAWCATSGTWQGPFLLVIAWLPLLLLCIWFQAGRDQRVLRT